MYLLAVLDTQGIVAKSTAAIFFPYGGLSIFRHIRRTSGSV